MDLFKKNGFIDSCLPRLANEARELYLQEEVPVLSKAPAPLEFYREYVSKNLPVIIESGALDWNAFTCWSDTSYLLKKIGSKQITVASTPTGYADAPLNEDIFVLPHESKMMFSQFLNTLYGSQNDEGILYIQKQNSNFLEEFEELIPDADTHIPWATEAFGKLPDAVNFWIGDERAVTSMHKDHYENLYVVVNGSKTFVLHPPTDLPFIPYRVYDVGKYVKKNASCFEVELLESMERVKEDNLDTSCCDSTTSLEHRQDMPVELEEGAAKKSFGGIVDHSDCFLDDNNTQLGEKIGNNRSQVPWVAIDPLNPDYHKYPQYKKAKQIKCTLSAGQMLYLPSLWFHHVTQTHGTIAVNFWYDMDYDIKYNYFKFVESLMERLYLPDGKQLPSLQD